MRFAWYPITVAPRSTVCALLDDRQSHHVTHVFLLPFRWISSN